MSQLFKRRRRRRRMSLMNKNEREDDDVDPYLLKVLSLFLFEKKENVSCECGQQYK